MSLNTDMDSLVEIILFSLNFYKTHYKNSVDPDQLASSEAS